MNDGEKGALSFDVVLGAAPVEPASDLTHLRRSHTRTEFPAAAYRTVPLGLRAIWLIWFSPAGMATVRLVLEEQPSPRLT